MSMRRTIGSGTRITTGAGRVISRTAVDVRPDRTRSVTSATPLTSSVNCTRTEVILGLCSCIEPEEFTAASVAPPEPPVSPISWLSRNSSAFGRPAPNGPRPCLPWSAELWPSVWVGRGASRSVEQLDREHDARHTALPSLYNPPHRCLVSPLDP
ncbi:hypothetical protein [Streptomyces sp. NPDC054834]